MPLFRSTNFPPKSAFCQKTKLKSNPTPVVIGRTLATSHLCIYQNFTKTTFSNWPLLDENKTSKARWEIIFYFINSTENNSIYLLSFRERQKLDELRMVSFISVVVAVSTPFYPTGICLFKVNDKNSRTMWCYNVVLVSLLLTLNKFAYCYGVSIIDLEKINTGLVLKAKRSYSLSVSVCLFICLSISLSVCLSFCICLSVSVSLTVFLPLLLSLSVSLAKEMKRFFFWFWILPACNQLI